MTRRTSSPRETVSLTLLLIALAAGCSSSARRLDPIYASEKYQAVMKFRYEPGVTDPGILKQIEPGDIVAFSSNDPSSASSVAMSNALSQASHVAIVFPLHDKLRVLSSDSDRGVYIDTIEGCVKGRSFFIFAFPAGLLDLDRLNQFAQRAAFLGRLDYNWMAFIGWNSNLTPNNLQEVGEEYTCATSVAAALHFSGLSLDRAWKGVVTPADIIFSVARRNLNGPSGPRREGDDLGKSGRNREAEVWEDLR